MGGIRKWEVTLPLEMGGGEAVISESLPRGAMLAELGSLFFAKASKGWFAKGLLSEGGIWDRLKSKDTRFWHATALGCAGNLGDLGW
jgi:hypothetical protein